MCSAAPGCRVRSAVYKALHHKRMRNCQGKVYPIDEPNGSQRASDAQKARRCKGKAYLIDEPNMLKRASDSQRRRTCSAAAKCGVSSSAYKSLNPKTVRRYAQVYGQSVVERRQARRLTQGQ
eukprot:2935828-Pleurochrysis_carterae.AAC.2